MKKLFVLLSCVFSLSAFAGEEFLAQMEKTKPREFEIVKINSGKSEVKYLYTTNCNAYSGPGVVSLNDQDQGYLKIAGRFCYVTKVVRLEPGEKRKGEKDKKDNQQEGQQSQQNNQHGPVTIDIVTSTGKPMQFYNNIK